MTGLATMPAGSQRTAEAGCPAGEIAVSGGYGLDSTEAAVLQSYGNGRSWIVVAENPTGVPTANVTAYAYCAPGVAFIP